MDRPGQWEAQVGLDLGCPSHLVGVWGVQQASPTPSYSSGEGQCIPEQGLQRVKYAGVQGSAPPGSVRVSPPLCTRCLGLPTPQATEGHHSLCPQCHRHQVTPHLKAWLTGSLRRQCNRHLRALG